MEAAKFTFSVAPANLTALAEKERQETIRKWYLCLVALRCAGPKAYAREKGARGHAQVLQVPLRPALCRVRQREDALGMQGIWQTTRSFLGTLACAEVRDCLLLMLFVLLLLCSRAKDLFNDAAVLAALQVCIRA